MPERIAFDVVVLWEDELRNAAKALRLFAEIREAADAAKEAGEEPDNHHFSLVALRALNACEAALYGIDDNAAITVSRVPDGLGKPRGKEKKPHA